MKARKKTTLEERIEIVQYCLENSRNYKAAADKFGCSYSQVRGWTIQFEKDGAEGLKDKRGRKIPEEELSEKQKYERKIAELERRNQYLEMEIEVLKKAEEWERRAIGQWPDQNWSDNKNK